MSFLIKPFRPHENQLENQKLPSENFGIGKSHKTNIMASNYVSMQ